MEVFKVFSSDMVLQRLAEQIIEDVDEEEISKVFSQGKAGFNSASWSGTAMRGSGGAVLRRLAVLTWKP